MNKLIQILITLFCLIIATTVFADIVIPMNVATAQGIEVVIPPLSLCTDNAVMIARAGLDAYCQGHVASWDMESRANASFPVEAHPFGATATGRSRIFRSTHS